MYSPYGSYPYPYPQQNTYMPQPPSMQMPSQTQPSETMLLQVGSAKDFDSVTLQPGRKALIMAQNEPFLAFKSADQMAKAVGDPQHTALEKEFLDGLCDEYTEKLGRAKALLDAYRGA